jgi:hypothetical protein
LTHDKRLAHGGWDSVPSSWQEAQPVVEEEKMKLEMSAPSSSAEMTRAQLYRDRSQQLREAARIMQWAADRQDLEWVAERYEVLARSLESGSQEFQRSLSK